MRLTEATIADLAAALSQGQTTAVALAVASLQRIAALDRRGPCLNAVPILNPEMFTEARASDLRRTRGAALGPLDGIPFTAKGSYKARGLPVDAGSPAFAGLIANEDSFAIERLRAAGAVLIGLTTMPPMANGGMQRGLHGRAESPYSADWLTAAFGSGSSNGSGTATAAGFGVFGLGEETWSSGRAPAANNGLCAYTPSRGMISVRGNWPLVPTMDVVVPQTRSMADLLVLLDVLVVDDPRVDGDFWRAQDWVAIAPPSTRRPASFPALAQDPSLAGKRLGIPAMYLNADPEAGTGTGIGGSTGQRIQTHPEIVALWHEARSAIEAAGGEVVLTDFPMVSNYEGDRDGAPTIATRGLVSPEYLKREIVDLSVWSWDNFLRCNADPRLNRLAQVDGATIFPRPQGALPDRYTGFDDDIATYPAHARADPCEDFRTIPHLAEGLRGLEDTRRIDLEDWMDRLGLDAVVFPAVADVGPSDADVNPASADLAWRNGVWVANGNLAIRHLGVPTVTVPLGVMAGKGMPAGLTFAGRSGGDAALLALAAAFEATASRRIPPPRAPECGNPPPTPAATGRAPEPVLHLSTSDAGEGQISLTIGWTADAALLWLCLDGVVLPSGVTTVTLERPSHRHSEWMPPQGPLVIAVFADGQAAFATQPV